MSYTLTTEFAGEVGVTPRLVRLYSNDDINTITAEGYLPAGSVLATDFVFCTYEDNATAILSAEVDCSGVITLVATGPGDVDSVFGRTGIVVAEEDDYSQDLIEGLKTDDSPTFANVNVGESGTAGTFVAYPSTAARGTLKIAATNNTGDTQTTITNAAMGQATVISFPDPGAATAKTVLDTGTTTMAAGSKIILAKNTGTEAANAVTINEQSGVITTSALTTAAGATYSITFTNSKIATSSVILLSSMGGTNTTKPFKLNATAGNGTSTLTIDNIDPAAALNGTIIIGFMVL